MTSVDAVFRWPIRLSTALGYDDLTGDQKSKDDIAADLDYRDTFTEDYLTSVGTNATDNATWTTYAPTFVNFAVNSGSVTRARYRSTTSSVLLQVQVGLAADSVMGTDPTVSLPIAGATTGGTAGSVVYLHGGVPYSGTCYTTGSALVARLGINGGSVTATVPFTWATGDSFRFSIEYERTT